MSKNVNNDVSKDSPIGSNIFAPGSVVTDLAEQGWDCHLSPFSQEIFPLAFIFSVSRLREQNFPLTTFVASGGQVPTTTLRCASNPTLAVKILSPYGNALFIVFCSWFFQILKLEIEKVAAQRSFLFLWCGSHEGLNEGRKVCKVLKLILWKTQYHTAVSVRDYAKSAKKVSRPQKL